MQKKNKSKKHRIFLSLTLLTSLFTQLTAPVAILAAGELNDSDPVDVEVKVPAEDPDTNQEGDQDVGTDTTTDPDGESEKEADDLTNEGDTSVQGASFEDKDIEATQGKIAPSVMERFRDVGDKQEPGTSQDSADEDVELIQTLQINETFDLALMHMNDTHSRLEAFPRMVTAVNSFRAANPDALLFHAGDVFSGTLYFSEFKGAADLELLNLMGINAMVFGNHEFDLGGSEDGHQALRDFVANSEFPFLGTNISFAAEPLLAPLQRSSKLEQNPQDGAIYDSIVYTINGEKVGVFSLTTEDTVNIASPMDVVFNDYIKTANAAVAEFENAGINKVIALTHLGYNTAATYGNDLVLAQTVKGIDIIVGGHSHTALATPAVVNKDSNAPTVIVQSGANAVNLGTLNVEFNPEGEIINHSGELLPVANYDPDPIATRLLVPFQEAVAKVNSQETGAVAEKDLLNPRHSDGSPISVRANETPLGNLITDAMLFKAREKFPEILFAVQNGGGIREAIPAGPITVGMVREVLPFANDPVIVELSGQEIKELFELSVKNAPAENGGFLHVSGLKLIFDSTRNVGDRVVAMYLDDGLNLVEINMSQMYFLTTNGYTGRGGDGLTPFADADAEGRVRDIGEIDWQQLIDYIVQPQYLNGVVNPEVEGRIVDLLGESVPTRENLIIERLLARLNQAEKVIDELEKEGNKLAKDIADLRADIANLKDALGEENVDIEALMVRLEDLEVRIAELEDAKEEPVEEEPVEEEPTTPGTPGDGSSSDNGGPTKDKGKDKTTIIGQKELPKAGMSIVLPLISGATLIISGLGVETYRRKRNN